MGVFTPIFLKKNTAFPPRKPNFFVYGDWAYGPFTPFWCGGGGGAGGGGAPPPPPLKNFFKIFCFLKILKINFYDKSIKN